ncbi:class I SAM-dependent rRNA methyltransferase [Desulfuromonas sp. KJ2020]|uniref:class I SAM-dependent rRNA methyltransferase n=1 Tax=Desulfuromonas sp. KJ2020 TaxID=2919173 RepID=UPI0020A7EAFB|nr:class I SAM-dependent rRNA methyltransferase [Desulfuromonas sp. KJ2020]MCP3178224.1 class I SAM-dependent rRNA methyltransferase [Desulfuromonas sp. KJ2020]
MTRLTLRAGHDRRARAGHPWIFSNEIGNLDRAPQPGEAVEVFTHRGEFLGMAYYNPHSLIAARILSRARESIDTPEFFHARFRAALLYRQHFYGDLATMRLVHGEGDGLPGLVVDRYGDILSLQILTLGMECRRQAIVQALTDLWQPQAIVARNDVAVRELEGLDCRVEILQGELPEDVIMTEHGLRFRVDVLGGQKTGHFLDQKENHLALKPFVSGHRVLDLFCYSGSWSVHAARYGAREVLGIDISEGALALARENARLNFVEGRCSFERTDVFDFLRSLNRDRQTFDTIILDPPAFVKSRKKLPEAIKGYLTINRRAMEAVTPGGYLFTCSCSHHMSRDIFLDTLSKAAVQAGRAVRLLEMRSQAYDHPVLLSCPETEYLKCAILCVE